MQYSRNNLTFNVLGFGDKDKETIILLHGFPANAQSWQPTAKLLAKKGYHVLVPEQRGYSKDARPKRRRDYRLSELVEDIVALLDSAGLQSAHIVGHDWGGVVAWAFAAAHPERTLSLSTISTPHPRALIGSIFTSRQLFLSWYMLFFQLPWLPELLIKKNLKKSLVSSGLSAPAATSYAKAMQNRALLTGAINWYRALPFTLFETKKMNQIQPPTLFIYGEKDAFLSHRAATATKQWVSGVYRFVSQPTVTHWIPEESPEWLAEQISDFITTRKEA